MISQDTFERLKSGGEVLRKVIENKSDDNEEVKTEIRLLEGLYHSHTALLFRKKF